MWTSFEDKLPDIGEDIIAIKDNDKSVLYRMTYNVEMEEYTCTGRGICISYDDINGVTCIDDGFTHWHYVDDWTKNMLKNILHL
jgi:hypothetical protein